ncbi:RluA family pseudouridine synthase [Pseudodesulfovibrio sp. zrk46]|uniref:RluA family pseudouridine synthase n=1 Tax=Pseudodesulfovibrio sp. zrk46 TaxID=2725288 RepID=UPI0014491A2B|nr:RluA family pseudouridine synthase [Pseudodesulfovibrio sp. zrk46]QJB56625.1 RluA family pseudouridine synthase [Pseudodesulfovibrio sp. zrk46]
MPKAQFITVTEAEAGQKLLQYLERRLKGDVPRSAIQRWIRKGQVRVDKGRKKPFDRIEAGQMVRIPPYTPGEDKTASSVGTLDIAHEEKHLLVVAKPAGLAAHGGDKIEDSVVARLNAMFKGADFMPTLAHRLDRDTSGLLLAAKDYATLRDLNDRFASGDIGKVYLAWVKGNWRETDTVLLEDLLEKQGAPGEEKVRTGSGKEALARVTGLVAGDQYSLVAVRLLTGRTHQIRVQLASRKHPVVGDRKYGKGNDRGAMRLHCFAMRVADATFSLPPNWTGKWSVPDKALQQALALLFD